MPNRISAHHSKIVDLAQGISVNTNIAYEQHPALRCGFAGYPLNPRWNAAKFHAWRRGRQWRNALAKGSMVVRSSDSMLVNVQEAETSSEEPPSPYLSPAYLPCELGAMSYQVA